MYRMLIAAGLTLIFTPLMAQEEAKVEEEASPWAGKISLGYLATSGNSESSSLNSNFEVGYTSGNWQHLLDAFAINSSENDSTTAESYGAGWSSERNITERDFLFGKLNYRNNRFSGFRTQFSQSVGYGRRIINTTAHMLSGQIGAGARQSETALGDDENDFIVNGGLNYQWTFSETANLTADLLVEVGEQNTYTEAATALRARLIGQLALVASYTVKNNSDVPAGTEKTDTFTALSLEYAF